MLHFTLHRFKHQTLSKRICRQLIRIPSLGLGRGVRCGQKIHGRLVTSFTVQKSYVKRIRVSELHLTACSLMDALLTSSLPCASVKLMCLSLQLSVTLVNVTHNVYVHFLQWGLSPALPTVATLHFLPCISKTCFVHWHVAD